MAALAFLPPWLVKPLIAILAAGGLVLGVVVWLHVHDGRVRDAQKAAEAVAIIAQQQKDAELASAAREAEEAAEKVRAASLSAGKLKIEESTDANAPVGDAVDAALEWLRNPGSSGGAPGRSP